MRPLVLTMQAFGPYANKETIDFTKLGNRTMFVISGKTGSGKTTIFDGISFAIYGKASGEDRNGQDLRSQFAPDELETKVTLQFYLKGKRYFISRTPKQLKKKVRGDGFREINATAELYVFDGKGEQQLLAAGVEEVDRKIKEFMQIDSHQFRQIMMIPQGEFRRLLTSDSKEKEVILQKLFHTEIYKQIEEKLKEQSFELEAEIKNEIADRSKAIAKIQTEFSDELKSYLEAGSVNDIIIVPLLIEEISMMTEKLELLNKELQTKEKEKEQLQQNLYEGENLVKQFQTLDALKERRNFLFGKQGEIKEKEQEIQFARKASHLARQDELCHRLKRELNRLEEQLQERMDRIERLSKLFFEKEKILNQEKEKEDERQKAQEQLHYLQSIHDEVKQLAVFKEKVQHLQKELQSLETKQNQLKDSLSEIQTHLEKLLEQKTSLEKVDISLVQNEREIENIEQQLNLLTKYDEGYKKYQLSLKAVEENKGKLADAVTRLEDAKKLLDELQQKWLQGQAAILAKNLHHGEACPVCGSTHHPNKSSHHGDLPTEADLKAAKNEVNTYEQKKSTTESTFLKSQSQMLSYQSTMEEVIQEIRIKRPDFSQEKLATYKSILLGEKKKLIEQKNVFVKQRETLEQINHKIKRLEKEKNMLESNLQEIVETYNKQNVQYTELMTTLKNMEKRIPEEIQSYEMFKEKLKEGEAYVKFLKEQFEKAHREWQEVKEQLAKEKSTGTTIEHQKKIKEKELETEREKFKTKLSEEGFKNYKEFAEAKRSEQQILLLEQEVKDYFAEVRSVSDQYELLYESLKGKKLPNIEELKKAVHKVREKIDHLNNEYTSLLVKKRTNEEIQKNITEINRSLKILEEKYKLIGELADVARGKNALRITFERYVLASFLDEILYEANIRLNKMTNGRYELRRKKDRAKGNVQSGLELLVFDQYTGQERHVKTLSGGESFKAALSLALGLADVVQSYAGGVSLETMFIDEGFGTLDPESLDQAIETLIDIQSSGRLVGIISHVPELRERIDARLEVVATQTGSTTKFVFTNMEYHVISNS